MPADHVLAQEPDAGQRLRRDRSVRLRISDGVKAPEVPSVIGQTQRTAEITLAQNQIKIAATADIQSASYAPDTIVAQDPAPKRPRAAPSRCSSITAARD